MPAAIHCRNCPGVVRDLFSSLLPEQRARFEGAALQHAYRAHESIFHEGTPALAVYCVRSGTIKLFRRMRDGEEIVVGVRGPGDLVGLRGVLSGIPYGSTATTMDPSIVCAIPGVVFLELVRENGNLAYRLLARLARESRLMEEQLVERTHSRVAKRVARFLVRQLQGGAPTASAPSQGHGVSSSREELAQLIGTTPETLSRTLHGLAADGVLALDRKSIRVLDLPSLLKRAE